MLPRTLQSVPSPEVPVPGLTSRCSTLGALLRGCSSPGSVRASSSPPPSFLVLVHVLLVCSPDSSCRRHHVLFAPFCVHLSLTSLLSRALDVPVRAPCACPQSAACLLAFLPRRPSWAPFFFVLGTAPSFILLLALPVCSFSSLLTTLLSTLHRSCSCSLCRVLPPLPPTFAASDVPILGRFFPGFSCLS